MILFELFGASRHCCKQPGDMWGEIRKFLRSDDLELRLMCLSARHADFEGLRGLLRSFDEIDVIRAGEDACSVYRYLSAVLN